MIGIVRTIGLSPSKPGFETPMGQSPIDDLNPGMGWLEPPFSTFIEY
jgi:hypothetical protein